MKGIFMGGTPPYGYKPRDRKLVIDDEEARNVRWIFSRFLEVGSATELAREVAKRGIRTPGGNAMSKNFLYRMLNNRAYIGGAVHKGTGYAGEHERLIHQKTWDNVQSILQQSPRLRASNTRAETPALLKGLLYGPDGAAFSPTHTRKGDRLYRYYVSQTVLKHGAGKCPVPSALVSPEDSSAFRRLALRPPLLVWRLGDAVVGASRAPVRLSVRADDSAPSSLAALAGREHVAALDSALSPWLRAWPEGAPVISS